MLPLAAGSRLGCGRRRRWRRGRRTAGLLLVAGVTVEGPRRCEFAELVTDHVLRDEHGHELATVVNGERQADRLREDRRAARPGLDDLLRAGLLRLLDLREQ